MKRFFVIITLFVSTALIGSCSSGEREATDGVRDLFVTDVSANAVSVFDGLSGGNVAPVRKISGESTGISGPQDVAVDTVHNEIFVANNRSITVYAKTADGNVTPLRIISVSAEQLGGIAVDPVNNEIFVTSYIVPLLAHDTPGAIVVYTRTANGDAAPLRTIAGPSTGLVVSSAIAVDTVNNEIFVANSDAVTVYERTAQGNAAPLRTINTRADRKSTDRIAVDTVNNEVLVHTTKYRFEDDNLVYSSFINVYERTAIGSAPPLRTIAGDATGLIDAGGARGIAIDTVNNQLFAATSNSILVFKRTADGNIAPSRIISGAATGLKKITGMALATQ